MVLKKSFRVWRKQRPRSVLLESKDVPDEALLFEADSVARLSPVETEIIRREYAESIPAYGCLGVLRVSEGSEMFYYLVVITECQSVGKVRDVEIFRITQTVFAPLNSRANLEMVADVGKLLACGRFYFAYPCCRVNFDLLCCAQKKGTEQQHFFWNRSLFSFLRRFGVDCDKWLFRTICGFVEVHTVYAGDKQAKACIISRLGCERAGTRFNVRGTNDDGVVGNFVESEVAIYVEDRVASFVQVRGLVPLFWEQPGLQTPGGMIRIKFSRGYTCSQPAFERHFEWCLLHYGPLLCINLLGTRNQEQLLSHAFQEHLQQLNSAYCAEMVCFDYHGSIRGSHSNIHPRLQAQLLPMVEFFVSSHSLYANRGGIVERTQTGTVRSNCLDCLDRTNSVQSFLSIHMLPHLMAAVGFSTKPSLVSRFEQLLSAAWQHTGDAISRLYAGSRALERKAKLRDGARSVQRTFRNNFLDSSKQLAIDKLLFSNVYGGEIGQETRALLEMDDALGPSNLKQGMLKRWCDFTEPVKLRVAVGTWNVNGGRHIRSIALRHQSMHDWLLDGPMLAGAVKEHPEEFHSPPDIFAIGFEELVGLTASNIVSASSSNRREWGLELQRVLSRDHTYELLTAEQLVGVCLYIFIRPKHIPYIRDVAVSTVKTGMSGKAGNKGAVAVRCLFYASSLCFVCSHFAAHQTKILERNQDFTDICRKIQFPRDQTVETHDYVFWCGDLNYRVDLPTSIAKDCIANRQWEKLQLKDQLIRQKRLKKVFHGFIEGGLDFPPTYKYDEFSDDYDTSEKCRVPAWCDRVLWRRKPFSGERFQGRNSGPSFSSLLTAESQLEGGAAATLDGVEEEEQPTAPPAAWDFGLHRSDAGKVCGEHMAGGVGGGLVNTGHPWHPGRLLFYGRAELKQSDHRPVIALMEVDVYRVNPHKRSAVKKEVQLSLGPSDPTVVIREQDEGDVLSVPNLLDSLRVYGEPVLVRVTEEATLVTFRHSMSALAATALNGDKVGDTTVSVALRSQWPPSDSGSAQSEEGVGTLGAPQSVGRKPERLQVLTSDQLVLGRVGGRGSGGGGDGGEEEEEGSTEMMEFSFSEEVMQLPEEQLLEGSGEDTTVDGSASGGTSAADSNTELEPDLETESGLGISNGAMEPELDGVLEADLDVEDGDLTPHLSSSSSDEDTQEEMVEEGREDSPSQTRVLPPRPPTPPRPSVRERAPALDVVEPESVEEPPARRPLPLRPPPPSVRRSRTVSQPLPPPPRLQSVESSGEATLCPEPTRLQRSTSPEPAQSSGPSLQSVRHRQRSSSPAHPAPPPRPSRPAQPPKRPSAPPNSSHTTSSSSSSQRVQTKLPPSRPPPPKR